LNSVRAEAIRTCRGCGLDKPAHSGAARRGSCGSQTCRTTAKTVLTPGG
jgi:hypothetical protein